LKYNTRLSVSLALTHLLHRHATVFTILSEKSHYHGKLARLIERVVEEYKEPPRILEDAAPAEKMLDGVRQVYCEAYSCKVFLRLGEQMVSEKKYSAVCLLEGRLDRWDIVKNDTVFNSKYYFMMNVARSLRQTEQIERSIDILKDLHAFCLEVVGEKTDAISTLYELAKSYAALIPTVGELVLKQDYQDQALSYVNQCYQLNYKLHGDFNLTSVKLLSLQAKCCLQVDNDLA